MGLWEFDDGCCLTCLWLVVRGMVQIRYPAACSSIWRNLNQLIGVEEDLGFS
jgi:hypothetical protein